MHFTAIATTLSFLSASASAAALVKGRQDPHQADLRTFGVMGCFEQNQGVYTLLQSDVGLCKQFVATVGSLWLTDIDHDNCQLNIYTDASCSESAAVAPVGICQNQAWTSYKLTCS